jgi:hypothetical protein
LLALTAMTTQSARPTASSPTLLPRRREVAMVPNERAETVLLAGGPVEGKHSCMGCGAYDRATVLAHRSNGSVLALCVACARDRERLARLVNALGAHDATGPLV